MPPEEYRFKPGQSGNPGGRPKEKPVTDELRRLMRQRVPNDAEQRTYARVLAQALLHAALKGKIEAVREILDRVEGRVPHEVGAVVGSRHVPDSTAGMTDEQLDAEIEKLLESYREYERSSAERKREAAAREVRALPDAEDADV